MNSWVEGTCWPGGEGASRLAVVAAQCIFLKPCLKTLFLDPCRMDGLGAAGGLHNELRGLLTNFLALIGVTQRAEKGTVLLPATAPAPASPPFVPRPSCIRLPFALSTKELSTKRSHVEAQSWRQLWLLRGSPFVFCGVLLPSLPPLP